MQNAPPPQRRQDLSSNFLNPADALPLRGDPDQSVPPNSINSGYGESIGPMSVAPRGARLVRKTRSAAEKAALKVKYDLKFKSRALHTNFTATPVRSVSSGDRGAVLRCQVLGAEEVKDGQRATLLVKEVVRVGKYGLIVDDPYYDTDTCVEMKATYFTGTGKSTKTHFHTEETLGGVPLPVYVRTQFVYSLKLWSNSGDTVAINDMISIELSLKRKLMPDGTVQEGMLAGANARVLFPGKRCVTSAFAPLMSGANSAESSPFIRPASMPELEEASCVPTWTSKKGSRTTEYPGLALVVGKHVAKNGVPVTTRSGGMQTASGLVCPTSVTGERRDNIEKAPPSDVFPVDLEFALSLTEPNEVYEPPQFIGPNGVPMHSFGGNTSLADGGNQSLVSSIAGVSESGDGGDGEDDGDGGMHAAYVPLEARLFSSTIVAAFGLPTLQSMDLMIKYAPYMAAVLGLTIQVPANDNPSYSQASVMVASDTVHSAAVGVGLDAHSYPSPSMTVAAIVPYLEQMIRAPGVVHLPMDSPLVKRIVMDPAVDGVPASNMAYVGVQDDGYPCDATAEGDVYFLPSTAFSSDLFVKQRDSSKDHRLQFFALPLQDATDIGTLMTTVTASFESAEYANKYATYAKQSYVVIAVHLREADRPTEFGTLKYKANHPWASIVPAEDGAAVAAMQEEEGAGNAQAAAAAPPARTAVPPADEEDDEAQHME